jgi:hypothetical protein
VTFDPYEVLGLQPGASRDDIEAAFDAGLAPLVGPDGVVPPSDELVRLQDAYVALGGYVPGLREAVASGELVPGESVLAPEGERAEPPGRMLRNMSGSIGLVGGIVALIGFATGALGGVLLGAFATIVAVTIWLIARSVDRPPRPPQRPGTPFDRNL